MERLKKTQKDRLWQSYRPNETQMSKLSTLCMTTRRRIREEPREQHRRPNRSTSSTRSSTNQGQQERRRDATYIIQPLEEKRNHFLAHQKATEDPGEGFQSQARVFQETETSIHNRCRIGEPRRRPRLKEDPYEKEGIFTTPWTTNTGNQEGTRER